ncbi:unnamed protein product [Cuscuta epithymum]|uniref:Uncharacterized protein n=1 Tax=Cuscuta epithymum TaxID=186058 RepID=A0AAV0CJ64_9ASTE|nr:unnamed protein product [Cuscuta epithymum]
MLDTPFPLLWKPATKHANRSSGTACWISPSQAHLATAFFSEIKSSLVSFRFLHHCRIRNQRRGIYNFSSVIQTFRHLEKEKLLNQDNEVVERTTLGREVEEGGPEG